MSAPQAQGGGAASFFSKYGTRQINVAALHGRRLQAIPPGERKIGRDWVPPMASLSLVVPGRVSVAHSNKLRATQLPKSFSWRNADDLKAAGKGKPVLGAVRNQLTCGSCWAVSSATVLSHRFSIAQQRTVELSETYLLACMSGGDSKQCNGGFPLEAGEFFEDKGIPTLECQPYTWCANSPDCAEQGQGEAAAQSNDLIPPCQDECLQCPDGGPDCKPSDKEFKTFKAKKGTTQQLITVEDIKADLFTYGPVVGAYAVMSDFLTAGADNFAQTDGVYINRQEQESPYGDQDAAAQIMGFHAVVITGWGEQDVKGFGKVPYWEVQNSWGAEWGAGGFWKHAMSDKERDINWKVGLDIPADFEVSQGQTQKIGGATVFIPNAAYVPTNGGNNNGDGSNDVRNNNAGNKPTLLAPPFGAVQLGWLMLGMLAALVLITLVLLLRC